MMFGYTNHRKDLLNELRTSRDQAQRELAKQRANLTRAELEVIGCRGHIAYQSERLASVEAKLDEMEKEDRERKESEATAKGSARWWGGDQRRTRAAGPQDRQDAQREGGCPVGATG